jgi:hypothetical protein
MLTHPQLRAVAADFAAADAHLARLCAATPDERWDVRRRPETWSVAEIIAHLVLTTDVYLPLIEAAIAAAPPRTVPRVYRCDPLGWIVSKAAGPLPKIAGRRRGGVRTPPAFVPAATLPRAELLTRFVDGQSRLLTLLARGERVPLDRCWLASPFAPRTRYTVYSSFVILPRHQERHLLQADDLWSDG